MVSLSREELEKEIKAVSDCIGVHEVGLKLASEGIKVNGFLKDLLEKELRKLPPATKKKEKPQKIEEKKIPLGVG